MAHGDERRWRSSIADRAEGETHRTTEPTGENAPYIAAPHQDTLFHTETI